MKKILLHKKTDTIVIAVILAAIVPTLLFSQGKTLKGGPLRSKAPGVEFLVSDYYYVSRPGSKGNYWKTKILNNGNDNEGTIALVTTDVIRMDIRQDGKVGIGTSSPQAQLHVTGDFISELSSNAKIGSGLFSQSPFFGSVTRSNFYLGVNKAPSMMLSSDNRYVSIFLDKPVPIISEANKNKFGLFVSKGILTEGFALGPQSSWADFVFSPEYQLSDLKKLEEYINLNKHLPGIPSAKKVETDGYDIHELNIQLLEKIEQLTLYIIKQQKQINQLEVKVNKANLCDDH